MKQVIGYYDKTFNSDFIKRYDIDVNDIIGTKMQKCFAAFVDSKTMVENKESDDIIQRMVSANIGVIRDFDKETFISEVKFENPIPEEIFFKYYGKDISPIYKNLNWQIK